MSFSLGSLLGSVPGLNNIFPSRKEVKGVS